MAKKLPNPLYCYARGKTKRADVQYRHVCLCTGIQDAPWLYSYVLVEPRAILIIQSLATTLLEWLKNTFGGDVTTLILFHRCKKWNIWNILALSCFFGPSRILCNCPEVLWDYYGWDIDTSMSSSYNESYWTNSLRFSLKGVVICQEKWMVRVTGRRRRCVKRLP